MRIFLTPILLVYCCAALAKDANTDLAQFAERSRKERSVALADAKARLNQWLQPGGLTRADKRERIIKRLETRIDELENPLKPYFAKADFTFETAETGKIGRFEEVDADVYQVVDEKNATIVAKWWSTARASSASPGHRAVIETDPKEVYRRIQSAAASERPKPSEPTEQTRIPERVVWLSGASTKGVRDGGKIVLNGLFAVTGTRTFRTADGSTNTVPVIAPFDAKLHLDEFTRKSELRKWTSKGGTHKLEAIFVRADAKHVTIMQLDGKTKIVELAKLSDSDQKYVREQLRGKGKFEKRSK